MNLDIIVACSKWSRDSGIALKHIEKMVRGFRDVAQDYKVSSLCPLEESREWMVDGFVAQLCLTLETPLTVARQAPLSMGFPRQEHWNGLPFSSPGNLPNTGLKLGSPALQADSFLTKLREIPYPENTPFTKVRRNELVRSI